MKRNESYGPASRETDSAASTSTEVRRGPSHEEATGRAFGSPAAYLIQSAARSMLDEATPDKVSGVSDDESDSDSIVDGRYGSLRSVNSSRLSSLQHQTDQPAIPNEQDRKRFVVSFTSIYEFLTSSI